MENFKVGDRVTMVDASILRGYIGESGVITEINATYHYVTFDCDGLTYGFSADKLKKEAKGMTKDQLKNYQLVQFRDGDWYVLFRDAGYSSFTRGKCKDLLVAYDGIDVTDLDTHRDDLSYEDSSLDIVKVATADNFVDILKGILRTDRKPVEELKGFTIIWTRENPKVKQLEELVEKLQGQLKDAEGELKRIQEVN